MQPYRPPVTESRKVLLAARPPVGEGPSTREVRAGLRELRPPLPVLVAGALMALVPLILLVLAGYVAVQVITGDEAWWVRALKLIPSVGLPFFLSALAWRGVKRAVHHGQYSEGFFVARLTTMLCAAIAAFLFWYVEIDGEPWDDTMVVPFLVLALVWLPALPLQTRSAREWPERVLLRRGAQVRSLLEVQLWLDARTHACGQTLPAAARELDPADDELGSGWTINVPCPACGQPYTALFRHRAEAAPSPSTPAALGAPGTHTAGLGGGDLMFLAEQNQLPPDVDLAMVPAADLGPLWFRSAVAVQVTEELLALIPAGKQAVPAMKRWGRPTPMLNPVQEFGRATLEQRLAGRQQATARIEQEIARRQARPAP
jgi:hypothetical protein